MHWQIWLSSRFCVWSKTPRINFNRVLNGMMMIILALWLIHPGYWWNNSYTFKGRNIVLFYFWGHGIFWNSHVWAAESKDSNSQTDFKRGYGGLKRVTPVFAASLSYDRTAPELHIAIFFFVGWASQVDSRVKLMWKLMKLPPWWIYVYIQYILILISMSHGFVLKWGILSQCRCFFHGISGINGYSCAISSAGLHFGLGSVVQHLDDGGLGSRDGGGPPVFPAFSRSWGNRIPGPRWFWGIFVWFSWSFLYRLVKNHPSWSQLTTVGDWCA